MSASLRPLLDKKISVLMMPIKYDTNLVYNASMSSAVFGYIDCGVLK